jgi:hypothetical protein
MLHSDSVRVGQGDLVLSISFYVGITAERCQGPCTQGTTRAVSHLSQASSCESCPRMVGHSAEEIYNSVGGCHAGHQVHHPAPWATCIISTARITCYLFVSHSFVLVLWSGRLAARSGQTAAVWPLGTAWDIHMHSSSLLALEEYFERFQGHRTAC